MSMTSLQERVVALFKTALQSVAPGSTQAVVLDKPRQADHGDFASTLALQLAKSLQRPPRELAQALLQALPHLPLN